MAVHYIITATWHSKKGEGVETEKGQWFLGGLEEHKLSRWSTWDSHCRKTILSDTRMVDSGCTFRRKKKLREEIMS